jgi:hypothetical protein
VIAGEGLARACPCAERRDGKIGETIAKVPKSVSEWWAKKMEDARCRTPSTLSLSLWCRFQNAEAKLFGQVRLSTGVTSFRVR